MKRKSTKLFASMLLAVLCISLIGCTASKDVVTKKATDINARSVTLHGSVNTDFSKYNYVAFGIMYSTNRQAIENRNGEMVYGEVLDDTDYSITLRGLTSETKYYYCAFVCLNGTQYKYGAIKHFTTKKRSLVKKTGRFSVSEGRQVAFSRGNLQYVRSSNILSFAEQQYDMIGLANVRDGELADKIDLFSWNTTESNCRGNFEDWGTYEIGTDAPDTWRTLTIYEWDYLLRKRANANNLKGVARINLSADGSKCVNGLILLPDDWICPDDVLFSSGFSDEYSDVEYSILDWQSLEAAGAVFLPAAGYLRGSCVKGAGKWGYWGKYWSATSDSTDDAKYLYLDSTYADCSRFNDVSRSCGLSVRLVRDL